MGNLREQIRILERIGELYKAKEKHDKAIQSYKGALKLAEKLYDLREQIRILESIGELYNVQGNCRKALIHYDLALEVAEKWGDLRAQARILENLGEIYLKLGIYSEAHKCYRAAMRRLLEQATKGTAARIYKRVWLLLKNLLNQRRRESLEYKLKVLDQKRIFNISQLMK